VSPGADLEEMQSLLYLIEEGNAHRRHGKLHHALKKYHAVRKVSYLGTIRNSSLLNRSMRRYLRNSKMINLIFTDIPYESLP
jgi:hypothetical protein